MANPNIVTTSSIYGKTDVLAVTTTPTNITENSAGSGKVIKVNSVTVANITTSNNVDVDVSLYRSGTAYYLLRAMSLPTDSTVVVVGKENPFYLMEGDSIQVTASAGSSAHAVCSYEEIS